MSTIHLEKISYSRDGADKVIDKEFNQLSLPTDNETSNLTMDDFFVLYDNIFEVIPKEGDNESHRYILNRTTEYLGVKLADDLDVNALLEEITSLRQQLLESQETVNELIKK